MKIRVTVTYEQEVEPAHYPEDGRSPTEMAQLDIDTDPVALLAGANYTVAAIEVPEQGDTDGD